MKRLWSRRPRLTRSGLYVLTLTTMAAQVAFVTGNNLFWFMFATGASLLMSNAWLAFAALRRISLRRQLPQTAFALESFAGGYEVANHGRLPAFYVFFEDVPQPPLRPGAETRAVVTFAATLPARQTVHVPFFARLSARGWNRFRSVRLSSDFPFGFIRVSRDIAAKDEVLVYPRVGRVLQSLPLERAGEEFSAAPPRPQPGEDDFAGMHEWRPGDNPKAIHWPSWGRIPGVLLVREYERTRVPRACLILDRESSEDRRFEQVVSFAAANLLDLHEHGVATTLSCGGGEAGAGVPEILLADLAQVERTAETSEALSAAVRAAREAGDLPVVIGDGTRKRHKDAAWAKEAVLVDVAAADFRSRYAAGAGS